MAYANHDKKNKRYRFYFYVDGNRSKPLTFRDTITKQEIRDLTELVEDIQKANELGNKLITKKSWETLKAIREGNSKLYQRILSWNVFKPHDNDSLTLEKAFKTYISKQHHWRQRTIINWQNTARKLVEGYPLSERFKVVEKKVKGFGEKLIKDISLEDVEDFYGELRKYYQPATLEKDCKNIRQLFAWLKTRGEIDVNGLRDFKFVLANTNDRVADKDFVDVDWFITALNAIDDKYIEQKTYLAYVRWMGARQSDPKGDRWEDVINLDGDGLALVTRYCCKKRQKIGQCPIEQNVFPLRQMLLKYRQHVIEKNGEAKGSLFPWLDTVSSSRITSFFTKRMKRKDVEVWSNFFNSLRMSRSLEIRLLPNGRKIEEMIIGHSAEVADVSYHPKLINQKNQAITADLFFTSFESANAQKVLTVDEEGKEVA